MNNLAIGIMDSGIGGLSVVQSIKRLLPQEHVYFFGDTANLPYGNKPPEWIKQRSLKIIEFLLQKNVKAIVIACHTASTIIYHDVQHIIDNTIPLITMIPPTLQFISQYPLPLKNIAIIGTQNTIDSNIYVNLLQQNTTQSSITAIATPLLAPMIEDNFYTHNINKDMLSLSLSSLHNIDALVLACTHYPLIKKNIQQYYKQWQKNVTIIDPSDIVAQYIKDTLTQLHALCQEHKSPSCVKDQFFVSKYTHAFAKSIQLLTNNSRSNIKEQNF